MLGNIHRTGDAKIFEPADFMPTWDLQGDEADDEVEQIDVTAASQALGRMLGRT